MPKSVASVMVIDFDEIAAHDPDVEPEAAIRALARAVCTVSNATVPVVAAGGVADPDRCTWAGFSWIPIEGIHLIDELYPYVRAKQQNEAAIDELRRKVAAAKRPIAVVHTIPIIGSKDHLN